MAQKPIRISKENFSSLIKGKFDGLCKDVSIDSDVVKEIIDHTNSLIKDGKTEREIRRYLIRTFKICVNE